LYEIQQQTKTNLIQTFPKEHLNDCISSLIQLNPKTLISSSSYSLFGHTEISNVIVIWYKSKSKPLYEPIQRITRKETGDWIKKLVLLNQKRDEKREEEFASCYYYDNSIVIWRRKGKKEEFEIKQKIKNVGDVETLLYISLTNELMSGSDSSPSSSLLQIWAPSASSFEFEERQRIKTSSGIGSLCQINETRNGSKLIEFVSGHQNGQIMIWSKEQETNETSYSLSKTLQPFNDAISDLIFVNDEFIFLISSCPNENKVVIFKERLKEKEELQHEYVRSLIYLSNGIFASGGSNQCLNIWSPHSYSSSSS